MSSSVYFIINQITGKVYVGKANDPSERWERHRKPWQHKQYPHFPLYKALKKYGASVFSFDVVETFDTEELAFEGEVWWIAYLSAIGAELYNCTPGGEGRSGVKHKESTRRKMANSHKKRCSRAHFAFENSRAY